MLKSKGSQNRKKNTLHESIGGKVNDKKLHCWILLTSVCCFGGPYESRSDLLVWGEINFMSQAIGGPKSWAGQSGHNMKKLQSRRLTGRFCWSISYYKPALTFVNQPGPGWKFNLVFCVDVVWISSGDLQLCKSH